MRKIVSLLIFILVGSSHGFAQNWSDDEQSLIDAVWTCWEVALSDMSPEALHEGCHPTEDTTYWWTPETAPFKALSSWLENQRAVNNNRLLAQDLRPLAVQVIGDFGFIWLHGIRHWQSWEGEKFIESWRGYETWQRMEDGGWSFHGGMGTPDMDDN